MKCFSEDITASSASILLCINRNTINSYYSKFRELLLDYSLRITGLEQNGLEVSEAEEQQVKHQYLAY